MTYLLDVMQRAIEKAYLKAVIDELEVSDHQGGEEE